MSKFTLFGSLFGAAAALAALSFPQNASAQSDVDYSKGVFIINEDWFGHNNSTVNYLSPDAPDGNYWHYRVFQSNNEGHELGVTAEAGEIWNGRFYIICKQPSDKGGRVNVANAKTMEMEYQLADIDPDGGNVDGRTFIGVDEHKGYLSSSNGVWILDLDSQLVTGKIGGTESGDDSLYEGQTGSMARAGSKVFVAHQTLGLLVIDPAEDKVVKVISFESIVDGAGIGSVIVAKDGDVWCSVAANGGAAPYLLKVDPETLATETVEVPSTVYPPANSWYAWTPDGFCASSVTNSLFWNGGSSSWFSGEEIFRFDIDSRSFTRIINLKNGDEGWQLYGCSMRVHPISNELYVSLFQGYGSQSYMVRRYTADGEKLQDYPMIENYWFPAQPVFAQSDQFSGVANVNADDGKAVNISVVESSIIIENGNGQLLEVYNISGARLFSRRVTSDSFILPSAFAGGIYVVRVGDVAAKVRL